MQQTQKSDVANLMPVHQALPKASQKGSQVVLQLPMMQ